MNKTKILLFFKYSISGLFLLILFHFESISLGPFKISHVWKGCVLIFLTYSILKNGTVNIFIFKPLLLLAVLQIFNFELVNNLFNAFLLFGTTLILSFLGIHLLKYPPDKLRQGLLFFASFFILAFIPYQIGILESIGNGYKLDSFGGEQTGIVGPFQGVHAASTALAGSFLTILYFWFSKTFNKFYLSVLLILGFYFLIFTYVRTGMLMVVMGVIPMVIFFSKGNASTRIRLAFISGFFSILISVWVLSNATLMDRITGNRINRVETDSFEDLGSGRGEIFLYAIDIFLEADIFEKILGMGQTEQLKRMESKLGSALIPHNGFLLILLNNGILGLIAFLAFITNLFKFSGSLDPTEKVLIRSLLYAYLIMTFFQNFDILYMFMILVLSVAYSNKPMMNKPDYLYNS